MTGALTGLTDRLENDGLAVCIPQRASFREYLETDARVRSGRGLYVPYSFEGREALIEIVETIDRVLGSHTGAPLQDARIGVAGGAQFGKTVLELNLGAYTTGQLFRNFGLYLPDDDLVQGVVDTKFRPDVLDQVEWFAQMVQVGKSVNKSGRSVNRKGAFTVNDGRRRSEGMIRGLGKVPTTFSMDVAAMDEVDDIDPKMAKFVKGRLTASDLRFILEIGTQRIHSRGMNARWRAGSQGVVEYCCPGCSAKIVPEENFPQIIRLAMDGHPQPTDPQLTQVGDFRRPGDSQGCAEHDPGNVYYMACPECAHVIDRTQVVWHHRQPDRIRLRHWSYRISQLSIAAIDLSQIVAGWAEAVVDPDKMVVFMCDVLANPKSTSQSLQPDILDRAREVDPYDMPPRVTEGVGYGGLDLGDQCWFFARELTGAQRKMIHAEKIPAGDLVRRAVGLFHRLGLSALFLDQRPSVNEARTIALALNGLDTLDRWPEIVEGKDAWISLPGGLTWDGRNQKWHNLRCAVVRFDRKKLGAGIRQGFDRFDQEGQSKFVPLIDCNRFETIDRVVREFLTPAENVIEVAEGKVRETPAMLLPRRMPGSPPILETLESHLIAGSERETESDGSVGDYVDGCANHLLLADGYSALAELLAGPKSKMGPFKSSRLAQERRRHAPVGRRKGVLI